MVGSDGLKGPKRIGIPHAIFARRVREHPFVSRQLRPLVANYADIINSTKHYFSHRWTLSDFLSRKNGIDRFIDREKAMDNFRNKNGLSEPPVEPPEPTEEEKEKRKAMMDQQYEKITARLGRPNE